MDFSMRRTLISRRFENNQSTGGIVENNILSGAFAFGIVSPPTSFRMKADNTGSSYSSRLCHFEQFFHWQCFIRMSPLLFSPPPSPPYPSPAPFALDPFPSTRLIIVNQNRDRRLISDRRLRPKLHRRLPHPQPPNTPFTRYDLPNKRHLNAPLSTIVRQLQHG
jgi:hypothetical protein